MSGWEELDKAVAFIDKHPDDWNPLLTVRQAREWVVAAKTVRAALSGSTAPLDRDMLRCGQCGDDLLPEHVEGHLNSEGRTLRPVTEPAAPAETLCGCGHDEASHFPACLAEVEDKPRQEFASPFNIETGRWEPRYICGCPAFGSPGGAALGKRRAKNAAARLAASPDPAQGGDGS